MTTTPSETSIPAPETMYLSQFRVKNFRSCLNVEVLLQPTLTLLVGEDNAGKSNVIDALRLATLPLSGRRSRYFEQDDLSRDHMGPIELTARYAGLSHFQRAHYIGALDLTSGTASYTTRFHPQDDTHPRGQVEQLSGTAAAIDGEPEKREQINHVYLAPLRDAQRELDSASGGRLAHIMQYLVGKEQRDKFVEIHFSLFLGIACYAASRAACRCSRARAATERARAASPLVR